MSSQKNRRKPTASGGTTRATSQAKAAPATSREKKRQEFAAGSARRRTPLVIAGLVVVVVAVVAAVVFAVAGGDKTAQLAAAPAPTAAATGGGQSSGDGQAAAPAKAAASVPLADISSKAGFYSADVDGAKVTFFVVKAADGTVHSAFDACQVCYSQKKGYRQEGTDVVCNNCGRTFPIDLVGVEHGGCNPVPLEGTTSGGQIAFSADALASGTTLFQ